jgi:hypothetical protein
MLRDVSRAAGSLAGQKAIKPVSNATRRRVSALSFEAWVASAADAVVTSLKL